MDPNHNNKLLITSTIQTINEMIAELYDDTKTINERMEHFAKSLYNIIYFEKSNVLFYEKMNDTYKTHSSFVVNWDKKSWQSYNEWYCQFDDVLPILDSNQYVLFRTSDMFDSQMRQNTVYYREFLDPENLHDSIEANFKINSESALRGIFSIHRPRDKRSFSIDELEIIKLFQPHFTNVLRNYGSEASLLSFLHLIEQHNCVGICLFDKELKLIGYNPTFETFLEDHKESDYLNNVFINTARAICKKMEEDQLRKNIRPNPVEHKFSDRPVFLEVNKAYLDPAKTKEYYCCMFYDLSRILGKTLDQIKHQYDLTPREFEIVNRLLRGYSNDQIAKELFISIPTVKKHLASLYCKMDINGQKQIMEKIKFL
ncbi:MAG: LuxR C-terminal-related transcriptional regulator [Dehalobacterium sp.]